MVGSKDLFSSKELHRNDLENNEDRTPDKEKRKKIKYFVDAGLNRLTMPALNQGMDERRGWVRSRRGYK
jgi:hypothetical protein